MKLAATVWLLGLLLPFCTADAVDDMAKTARDNVYKVLDGTLSDGTTHTSCTKDKLMVRKEWGNLSTTERKAYTTAVLCLQGKPSKVSPTLYPGARTRFDDFVAIHINQTMRVHGTASFLGWHRYYVYSYEKALRDECGYQGVQPYWNWAKYPNPLTSPIFNGDEFSMSGNGEKVQHAGSPVGANGVTVPAGEGGGCVTTGPFRNMSVNLGPIAGSTTVPIPRNPRSDGLGYNPRCLRRDISSYFTNSALRVSDIQTLITGSATVGPLQDKMQMDTRTQFGVHSGGHFTIWGDPAGDFYVSPGDPAFWLHHGMIDRVWWIWQNQDPAARVHTIAGGSNMFGGGAPGKMTDEYDLDVVGGKYQLGDWLSSTSGPFCYVYE